MISIIPVRAELFWKEADFRHQFLLAMWLMFLRAPRHQTTPGEPVDLGEIGACAEKTWERLTPCSLAQLR